MNHSRSTALERSVIIYWGVCVCVGGGSNRFFFSESKQLKNEMKQDEYSISNQLWNAGATEAKQLNPGGPNKRQVIRSQPA